MNLTHWQPFREMEEMSRQYSPFLSPSLRRRDDGTAWAPVSDITETDNE